MTVTLCFKRNSRNPMVQEAETVAYLGKRVKRKLHDRAPTMTTFFTTQCKDQLNKILNIRPGTHTYLTERAIQSLFHPKLQSRMLKLQKEGHTILLVIKRRQWKGRADSSIQKATHYVIKAIPKKEPKTKSDHSINKLWLAFFKIVKMSAFKLNTFVLDKNHLLTKPS